jgi:hypothetical protein
MPADPNSVEQAISRTLRDNLVRIQRASEELNQAISDLVSACASSRPSNALPPMVRAQACSASLSAALDVIARFVTNALQPANRVPAEPEVVLIPQVISPEPPAAPQQPEPILPRPMASTPVAEPAPPVVPPVSFELPPVQIPPAVEIRRVGKPVPVFSYEPLPESEVEISVPPPMAPPPPESPAFNLGSLPPEEQELHRRAYRVAKVSMQDIKMLRPEDVELGRENKDLCFRLRDDIEKARKEYDRRFQPILSHPVDYFYDWMVEILGGGDPATLGEYPYPSPVVRL